TRLIDHVSRYFTVILLLIAFGAAGYWMFYDVHIAINVFTAVLIIACPCALAMSTPFTLGNMLRIFGNKKFYLKNAGVIEQLARANAAVFDKPGTITSNKKNNTAYDRIELNAEEEKLSKTTLGSSGHPLSRMLYEQLAEYDPVPMEGYRE